ncbi:50S ribosomal protein L15 [Candidatus Woesearchaeota archaeon]|nr:50S ribosomal protein L15 [Candidatus Woesearchaeota archaeon]
MANVKRKKVRKYRGSKTHGGGSMKKRRGAGNRGGRGNAGTGKRGDQNKPSIWKYDNYPKPGKHGFKTKNKIKQKPINLLDIERKFDRLLEKGIMKKKESFYILDLKDMKKNKLLGTGNITKKMKITTLYASASAVSKVKKAGGEVVILKPKKEKKDKQEQDKEINEEMPEQDAGQAKDKETKDKKEKTEKKIVGDKKEENKGLSENNNKINNQQIKKEQQARK